MIYAIATQVNDKYELNDFRIAKDNVVSELMAAIEDIKGNKKLTKTLPHNAIVLCLKENNLNSAFFDKNTKTFDIKALDASLHEHLFPRFVAQMTAKDEFVFLVTTKNLKHLDRQDRQKFKALNLAREDAESRVNELQGFLTGEKEEIER